MSRLGQVELENELFMDWCNSMPTCVIDSFWWIKAGPNFTDIQTGGLLLYMIKWNLDGLNKNLHLLEYSPSSSDLGQSTQGHQLELGYLAFCCGLGTTLP